MTDDLKAAERRIRLQALADAWDEGFRAGDGVGAYSRREREGMNPYREESDDGE